jgi:protein DGCR14
LYGAEQKHDEDREQQLALPSFEQQALGLHKPLDVDGWKYRNQNYIMFIPDGKIYFKNMID